jgi:predicted ATP-dependent protease
MKKVVVPQENQNDLPAEVSGLQVVLVQTVEEALPHVLVPARRR